MAEKQGTRQKWAAGATEEAKVQGKLVEYSWWLKKQGYAESTIRSKTKLMKLMVKRGADLWDPESVKEVIAKQETWSEGVKANAAEAYSNFLIMEGLTWTPPRYRKPAGLPFIPLESELDQLVAGCGSRLSIFIQGLKETGADPGELWRVRWIDVNKQACTVTINRPVKGHNPRILPVSAEWIRRLEQLPKAGERVFAAQLNSLQRSFHGQRKLRARDFDNPRLLKVTFTTFRHWKATVEYHRTKDILYVMRLLGHKTLKSTLVYIDLEKAIYGQPGQEEFTVRVATSLKEACELVEAGFDYVTDMEGGKIFRKRK